jgi:hypothetical protein
VDSDTWTWDVKHYRLTISYEDALANLTALWGNPTSGWSLQSRTTLSDEAQNNGVIFEDTLDDYRLCRVVNGIWEAVGWEKRF